MNYFKLVLSSIVLLGQFLSNPILAQKISDSIIKQRIENYKNDLRGPYKSINWFCKDGTIKAAMDPCGKIGGVQRAAYKDEVVALQKSNHIFLGQILATTEFENFWDANNQHSRLKQYQLEQFLQNADNGWIIRKAKFYRGSVQAEDEEAWGINFYDWLLKNDSIVEQKFYLIRNSAKNIPHKGDDNKTQSVRALSKTIAEKLPAFMDIRVKIHGLPSPEDLQSVKEFRKNNSEKITPEIEKLFDTLIKDMEFVYRPKSLNDLKVHINKLNANSQVRIETEKFISNFEPIKNNSSSVKDLLENYSRLLLLIREDILNHGKSSERLALIDLSLQFEDMFFQDELKWKPTNLRELIKKNYITSQAAAGTGLVELWEWYAVKDKIKPVDTDSITLEQFITIVDNSKRFVEWGAGMVNATYENVVELYEGFEPLAHHFIDDQIRSSLLLPLGRVVSTLSDESSEAAQLSNKVLNIANQNSIRGLNPGIAFGELQIIQGSADDLKVDPAKIYAFSRPPADLKPVAGILTVSEGNLVSHVQLLARNLGIPNAVVSSENLTSLKKYEGKKIFYAVSRKGTVIMKTESEMTKDEKSLFTQKKAPEEEVKIPTDKLILEQNQVIDLRNLRSEDSGKLCGPKAANLGELKYLFPENVVEGIVIPFGIFKDHMDQKMASKNNITYWEFLSETFENAAEMEKANSSNEKIEEYIFGRLAELRESISKINLKPEFLKNLRDTFRSAIGTEIGTKPVFIRSDTNMEDLKDFSGAGLNLTVFNVLEEAKILQGIRDVWASPYTERSYKWRQKFLKNPQDVYPSILIIPSVDVEKSGVIITTGVISGNPNDITIAFSKGAGGAVEGQRSESYVVKEDGEVILLSPSRETHYTLLPAKGGTQKGSASLNKRLLSPTDIDKLKTFAKEIKNKFNAASSSKEKVDALDIELGILDNKIWLFQVRPFVENKRAKTSTYLQSITPEIPLTKVLSLTKNIN